MSYQDQIVVRNDPDFGSWYWVKGDQGGFEIPRRDWIEGHSKKYFTHVKNYDTVVTGGTCCGMYVRFYSSMFKRVIAFEPDPLSFFCMSLNIPVDNVVKLNAAMGEKPGIVGLNRRYSNNIGMNTVGEPNEFRIPLIPIDGLALDACDLLQLDVEGYEEAIIKGAKKTIKKYRPVIITEAYDSPEAQALMKSIGYKMVDKSFLDVIYIPE